MRMIGDRCLIIAVKPGSDAEKKGLRPGHEIGSINGVAPTRNTFFKLLYVFNRLRPQPGLRLGVRSPAGEQQILDVMAEITPTSRVVDVHNFGDEIREYKSESMLYRNESRSLGEGVLVWKMPDFFEEGKYSKYGEKRLSEMMSEVRKHQSLILDLRGNQGGSVELLEDMVG